MVEGTGSPPLFVSVPTHQQKMERVREEEEDANCLFSDDAIFMRAAIYSHALRIRVLEYTELLVQMKQKKNHFGKSKQ